MFRIARVNAIRRVLFALSMVLMASLLGACTHTSPTDTGGEKSWVVEDVASKTTAELYADIIAPAVFERSNLKSVNGYTVESGKLRMPDKSEGSLVTVRSADGSLTALINTPDKNGLLRIDSKGTSYFISEPQADPLIDDWVKDAENKVATSPVDPVSAEPHVIDLLMGYSRAGLNRAGGDALADSLAKVEYINMALRNSLVTNVSFRLVGIQIVEQDYLVTTETLGKVPTIFAEGISSFQPDVVYGNFLTTEPGGAIGWAWIGGRFGIGIASGHVTFAHELGHNAGSGHCNDHGVNNYKFGYFNGKSGSLLCGGNRQAYYSNPAVKDEYGLPRGNSVTADTARVWRENAERLSSYALAFNGERMILAGVSNDVTANLTIVRQPTPTGREAGVLAYSADEGPIRLVLGAGHGVWAPLTATLMDGSGRSHKVKLRGSRWVGTCQISVLNNAGACSNGWDINVIVQYLKSDNPGLPVGMYTGEIKLQAVNLAGTWSRPIAVAISIRSN